MQEQTRRRNRSPRQQVGALLRHVAGYYDSLGYLRDRRLALLGGAGVLDTMSVSLITPLLPLYAAKMGASPLLIGVMFAAETAAQALLSTPLGYLADRFERRLLVAVGVVLSGLAVAALGFVATPLAFVALRFVDGAAGALRQPATRAYIGDCYPAEERGRAMGAHRTLSMAGLALGPAVGGLLAVDIGYAAPFVALGALTVIAGLAVWIGLPPAGDSAAGVEGDETESEPGDAADGPAPTPTVPSPSWLIEVATPTVVALALTAFVASFGAGAFAAFFARLLARTVDAGAGYIGLAYAAFGGAMFLFTPVGGTLADRVGRLPGMVGGRLAWVAIYAGLVVATVGALPPVLLFVGGFASALAGPAGSALQYETAPDDSEASLIGVYGSVGAAGSALGPLVGGWIAAVAGVRAVFLVLAALATVDGLAVWALVEEPDD